MHIAISGASGFVGRRLIEGLEPGKHTVVRLGRDAGRDLPRDSPLDAVVHLAGEPVAQRWSDMAKARIRDSRIIGTRNLVRGMGERKSRPPVLVCASAVGYYGDRGDQLLDESAAPADDFLAGVCRDWESEADRAQELGIRVVKIRIGVVLGKGGGAMAKMLTPFRLGLGARLGNGKQWMSWVHLDDVVGMIRFAIEQESARGAWNGTAPNPVTNAEFTRQLASAVHRPAWFVAPEFLLRLGAGDMAQMLYFSQRCIPAAPLAAGYLFRYPDLGPALQSVVT